MAIKNIVEKFIWDNMDTVLEQKKDMCSCPTCKNDIAAYALNKLKPHYASSAAGEAITRAYFMENQYYLDMIIAITEAVEIVSTNPHHRVG